MRMGVLQRFMCSFIGCCIAQEASCETHRRVCAGSSSPHSGGPSAATWTCASSPFSSVARQVASGAISLSPAGIGTAPPVVAAVTAVAAAAAAAPAAVEKAGLTAETQSVGCWLCTEPIANRLSACTMLSRELLRGWNSVFVAQSCDLGALGQVICQFFGLALSWTAGGRRPGVGSAQSVWYSCFSLWLYLHALLKPHQRYCRWNGQSISPADPCQGVSPKMRD